MNNIGTARILIFDDESTELSAEGDFLVFGYKWLGEKTVHVPSVLDHGEPCNQGRLHYSDNELVKECHRVMSGADVVVTYNGKNFDWKLQNTKFLMAGLPALQPMQHIDLYQVAKHTVLIRPKSLKNLARVFELKNQKTNLDWNVWRSANKGDMRSLRYIRTHCKADILATEELYYLLRPYIKQHPRVNGYGPCRRCGSEGLTRQGRAITIYRGQQFRFKCKTCGGWETRAM